MTIVYGYDIGKILYIKFQILMMMNYIYPTQKEMQKFLIFVDK